MKKATISISYDEEKLNALKMYLGQKEAQVENELTKALDTLYNKTVPAGVREFIDMRAGINPMPAPKPTRRAKPPVSSAVDTASQEVERNV